ncbi:hypothetical protein [Bacillus sp. REN16]|nr:hypothetical protein [Bacillus sp. REN16]MCC3358951.1 hypothetical protein [Bacillus sp. REN16]
MLKNPRFWGKAFQIVLAPAVLALGGLILELASNQGPEKDSNQQGDENNE